MLAVTNTFTAEAKDSTRYPAGDLLVSWKKGLDTSITFFTIGVSTIGGTDIIRGEGSVIQEWNKYQYFDESDQILSLDWERSLNMPIGGLNAALADGTLSNVSGRYTPHYMGGNSELFTAILPRRPVIINAGFEYNGIENLIPQFVGLFTKNPVVDKRQGTMDWQAADFIDFLRNKYVDQTTMFTSQRTDQVLDTILQNLGYATAQFELDTGINIIPFGLFEKGTRWADIVNEIVQAEYGHFYQDEEGKLRFENRQHWDASPHNTVQTVLFTADVLDMRTPSDDHIINVVEIKAQPRQKQSEQQIFKLAAPLEFPVGQNVELFVDFNDPILQVTAVNIKANTLEDGTGTNITTSVQIKSEDIFAKAAKYVFYNTGSQDGFITEINIYGRPAQVLENIYHRDQDDSSVTAYEERPLVIENNYIASIDWSNSFAQMILDDFAELENVQEIVIRAKPHLQLGDLVSWQGRYWRVFGIKTQLDPSIGFVQELKLLQRVITTYFRIGISTIGGSDRIAP